MTLLSLLVFMFSDGWHYWGCLLLLLVLGLTVSIPVGAIMAGIKETISFLEIARLRYHQGNPQQGD